MRRGRFHGLGLGTIDDEGSDEEGLWTYRVHAGDDDPNVDPFAAYVHIDEEFMPPDWPIWEGAKAGHDGTHVSANAFWGGDGVGFIVDLDGDADVAAAEQVIDESLRQLRDDGVCRVFAFPTNDEQESLLTDFDFEPSGFLTINARLTHEGERLPAYELREHLYRYRNMQPWEVNVCNVDTIAKLFPDVIEHAEMVEAAMQAPVRLVPEWFTQAEVIKGGKEDE